MRPDAPDPATGLGRTTTAIPAHLLCAPVLTAVWSRLVGSTWTVELRPHHPDGTLGPIVDWISSGIPISEPPPTALTHTLLTRHGSALFPDTTCPPRTPGRHSIGYVSPNPELIALAHLLHNQPTPHDTHPVLLATSWITAGFTPAQAASCIHAGTPPPPTRDSQTPAATLDPPPTPPITGKITADHSWSVRA